MYATASQLEAYQTTQKTTLTGRDLEASVLTKAAIMLKKCRDNWEVDDRASSLEDALKFNQRIWSIFQGELIKEDNPLPRKIKEDILSLSIFLDKKILDVMAFPEPEKLDGIININLNIAAGLRRNSGH